MRVLLVEDETRLAGILAKGLRENAYAVDVAGDGEAALFMASSSGYDVILLDLGLPLRDGYSVCRELRRLGHRAPVLMLTARDAVDDRVEGLDSGADDYLVKPFDFKELLARMRALLRRAGVLRPDSLRVADLELDTARHTAARAGRAISLAAKEYALLEFLMLNAGRVVGRAEIAQHVWDENFDPFSNTIDVHIRRLRAKLERAATPLIHTRRGEGYLLAAPEPVREG